MWIEVVCRERDEELMWETWGMKNHHEATLVCGYINSEPLTCLGMIVMLKKKTSDLMSNDVDERAQCLRRNKIGRVGKIHRDIQLL